MRKEKRKEYPDIMSKLAVITEKVETIDTTVQEIRTECRANSDKLIQINGLKDQFKNHATLDKWLFSGVMLVLIAILGVVLS